MSTNKPVARIRLIVENDVPIEGDPATYELLVDYSLLLGTHFIPREVSANYEHFDEDGVIKAYAYNVEEERVEWTIGLRTLLNITDPDRCDESLLPYLAGRIGLVLRAEDGVEAWRRQIKAAVKWYKAKGLMESFVLLMRSIGYECYVERMWISPGGDSAVEGSPLIDSTWRPHTRIRIHIMKMDGVAGLGIEEMEDAVKRIEEVRPAHVLLGAIVYGVVFEDDWPGITDDLDVTAPSGAGVLFTDVWPPQDGQCGCLFHNGWFVECDGTMVPAYRDGTYTRADCTPGELDLDPLEIIQTPP